MSAKRGFLLMNIGSPDEPSSEEIRNFLAEIDNEDLLDLPWPIRALIHKTSDHKMQEVVGAYQRVWSGNVSPMVKYCTSLAGQLQERSKDPVALGMAFGHPTYKGAIEKLLAAHVEDLCLLPLFAQYSLATVASCTERVKKELKHLHSDVTLRVVPPFYNHKDYIEAIAALLNLSDEHVLFNYHGFPIRHLKKADPTHEHCMTSSTCCSEPSIAHDTCYRHQCLVTSREIAKTAGIADGCYATAFQAHIDNEKWMAPFTDETLRELPAKGTKKLAVVCPALFCDCLETLEEIDINGRETFLHAGGESFRMIPCLNDSPAAVNCLESLMDSAGQWPTIK